MAEMYELCKYSSCPPLGNQGGTITMTKGVGAQGLRPQTDPAAPPSLAV